MATMAGTSAPEPAYNANGCRSLVGRLCHGFGRYYNAPFACLVRREAAATSTRQRASCSRCTEQLRLR